MITRLPCGSLRVRVYAGTDPITGKQRCLSRNIPVGPTALDDAEATCRELTTKVQERRQLRVDVGPGRVAGPACPLMHAGEHTRRCHRWMIAKHVHPILSRMKITAA